MINGPFFEPTRCASGMMIVIGSVIYSKGGEVRKTRASQEEPPVKPAV